MRTGGPDFKPSPMASRKKARTCSKCRATSRPLRSPAVVNNSKFGDWIFSQRGPSLPAAGNPAKTHAVANRPAHSLISGV